MRRAGSWQAASGNPGSWQAASGNVGVRQAASGDPEGGERPAAKQCPGERKGQRAYDRSGIADILTRIMDDPPSSYSAGGRDA